MVNTIKCLALFLSFGLLTSCTEELALERDYASPKLSFEERVFYAVTNKTSLNISSGISGVDLSFSISPALPAGLELDGKTGVLSGIPTTTFEDQTFVVTGSNGKGFVQVKITMTALEGHVVSSSSDVADANTADAVCETSTPGECTLRAAIEQNKADGGRKMVLLDEGDYSISNNLSFDSAGADILIVGQGSGKTSITSSNSASAKILTTLGSTTLKNLTIENFGDGATGPVDVINMRSTGELKLEDVVLQNNYATGAIIDAEDDSQLGLNGVYIYNNHAAGHGVIYVYEHASPVAVIERTTWYSNYGQRGGCLEVQHYANVTLRDSTCYGNTTSMDGRTAVNFGTCGCPTNGTVVNTLIAANTHTGSAGQPGGFQFGNSGTNNVVMTFANNIVTANLDSTMAEINCAVTHDGGVLTDDGSNIFTGADCSSGYLNNPTTLFNTDPLLVDSAPKYNGGGVPTIMISTSSPAVDGGLNSSCSSEDQRGFERPVDFSGAGANCDIGPLELQL